MTRGGKKIVIKREYQYKTKADKGKTTHTHMGGRPARLARENVMTDIFFHFY